MIELKKAPLVLGLMLDNFDTQSMHLDLPPVTELQLQYKDNIIMHCMFGVART